MNTPGSVIYGWMAYIAAGCAGLWIARKQLQREKPAVIHNRMQPNMKATLSFEDRLAQMEVLQQLQDKDTGDDTGT